MRKSDPIFSDCPVPFPTDRWRCYVVRVVDGDTYVLLVDRGWMEAAVITVRLANIDTPERFTGSEVERIRGRLAYEYAKGLTLGCWGVLVTTMDPDKYGRILAADILVRSHLSDELVSVTDRLIAEGHEK